MFPIVVIENVHRVYRPLLSGTDGQGAVCHMREYGLDKPVLCADGLRRMLLPARPACRSLILRMATEYKRLIENG